MKPPSEWLTPKYSAHTNTLEQSPHHCHIQRTNKYEKILCVEILLAVIAGLPVAIIDEIVWKAFWKLKNSYWQEILRLLACPSQQYQKNEMYLPSGREGATSPCWLLSADRELEAWIGFATFRRNWHGLCRHEYRANCRRREALQKSDTMFVGRSRRATLKFCLNFSYDSTNMSYRLTAYKS